jgi:pathogenesis-related protein 1
MILVTAAILTVQPSSMLQISYAQTRLDATSQNTILDIHNRERAAVGVPPVTWSDSVATGAQAWADYIVSLNLRWDLCGQDSSQCPFHASAQQNPNGNGENIAWGDPTNVAPLAESWVKEKSNYVPGSPIEPSFGLPDRVYGHYTAMVWSTTTQIGCGIAQQTFPAYTLGLLVCRYSPAGNQFGVVPYGQGATAPATNATAPAAVGEEQNTLCQNLVSSLCHDDQGAAAVAEEAPPAEAPPAEAPPAEAPPAEAPPPEAPPAEAPPAEAPPAEAPPP